MEGCGRGGRLRQKMIRCDALQLRPIPELLFRPIAPELPTNTLSLSSNFSIEYLNQSGLTSSQERPWLHASIRTSPSFWVQSHNG
jgi:hypothetical protein